MPLPLPSRLQQPDATALVLDKLARNARTEAASAESAAPWWCSPAGIAVGFLLPMFCLVSFAIELNLQGLTARGLRFLNTGYLLLGAGLILVMAIGGWIGQQIKADARQPLATRPVDTGALLVGALALLAYAIWFREYLVNPSALWAILSGAHTPQRADELIPGVTSLANGAPVFFSIYAWRVVMRGGNPTPRSMHFMCAVLAVMTAFRVYAWSERLALIEALLPVALMFSVRAMQSPRPLLRTLVRLGPFIALPMLMLYFGLAESVRSWSSDTYNGKLQFWDFVVGRMATYYYTALNNGAGYLATQDWPTFRFEYVLSMLHTAPLVGRTFSALVGSTGPSFDAFLQRYADIEFNNPSGFYTVVYDLGIPLALVYFATTGVLAGFLFRRYVAGSLTGALFYPVFFISYLEVFRYPYLGSGRAFAWSVCALLVLLIARWRPRRVKHLHPSTPTAPTAPSASTSPISAAPA